MSLSSKTVLWGACGLTLGTVIYVHYKQWADKNKLHEGVIRDIEKQQRRKIENLYFLQQQIEMEKLLKKQREQDHAAVVEVSEVSKT